MDKYVESYLIGLGFKLDDKDAKKWLEENEKIKQGQDNVSKSQKGTNDQTKQESSIRKTRLADTNKEIFALGNLEKTLKKVSSVWGEILRGNVLAAARLFGEGGIFKPLDYSRSRPEPAKPMNRAEQSAEPSKAPESGQKQTASKAQNMGDFASAALMARGASSGATEAQKLLAGAGAAEGTGASGGSSAISGALAIAGGPVGVAAAMAAAITAASVAASKMADNVSQANTNVESMSAQMWITNKAAWSLNNTLSAMGKSTADLNEIALNPTLRKQYEDMQKYQKNLKLPDDFIKQNQKYAETVGESKQQLAAAANYMKQMAGYRFEKIFGGPLQALNNLNTAILKGWGKLFAGNDANTSGNKSSGASTQSNTPTGVLSGNSYAPNTSNYSSNSQSVTIEHKEQLQVYAQSSDSKGIANETMSALQANQSEAALIRSIQGPNR